MIVGQLQHGRAAVAPMNVTSAERRLAARDKQRERLLRLFQPGDVDEEDFTRELANVRAGQERLGRMRAGREAGSGA